MSKVRIYGDTSGYVDIAVPAVAGTTTLNLDKVPQADISGNIAMDTDTLYVDSSNNRVGIGTATPGDKLAVAGNIAVTGTVDGRDVATDGTKLDGVEASATADQTKADIEGLGIDLPAANLTGTVAAARLDTATTQAESDDSTKIATTAYVVDKITTLIGGAPSTLNDLNELAAAINDDASYNSTLTTALATKLPLAGGVLTGNLTTNSLINIATPEETCLKIEHTDGPRVYFQLLNNNDGNGNYIGAESQELNFWTNNLKRMAITSAGSVGIGTTSPLSTLQVRDSGGQDGSLRVGGSAASLGLELTYDQSGATTSIIQANPTYTNVGTLLKIRADGDANPDQLVLTGAGNVGIGTSSPGNKLEVDGSIAFTKNGTSGNRWLLIAGADATYAGTMNIQAGFGSSAAGGAIKLYAHAHATYPGSTWIGRSAGSAGNIMFGNGGTGPSSASQIQMVINSSGKIGIGETSPANILHIKTSAGGGPQIELDSTSGTANSGFIGFDGTSLQLSTQRDMVDGSKRDTAKSWGGINIVGVAAGSYINFQTSEGNNNNALTRMTITKEGNVGIGATNPGVSKLYLQDTLTTTVTNAATMIANSTLTINGNSSQGSDVMRMGPMDIAGRYFIDVSNSAGNAAYDLLLNPIGGGNVGIGTTSATAKLDVSGIFKSGPNTSSTVTGAGSTVYNLTNRSQISGKINIPFSVYFANGISNLCVRLYYSSNSLWCTGEALIGATYSNQMAGGHVRYSFAHHHNGASSYGQTLTNTENIMNTSSHFSLHDHGWDSTEGAHYFEFRHLTSTGNSMWVQFQCHGAAQSTAFDGNWYYKHKTF